MLLQLPAMWLAEHSVSLLRSIDITEALVHIATLIISRQVRQCLWKWVHLNSELDKPILIRWTETANIKTWPQDHLVPPYEAIDIDQHFSWNCLVSPSATLTYRQFSSEEVFCCRRLYIQTINPRKCIVNIVLKMTAILCKPQCVKTSQLSLS